MGTHSNSICCWKEDVTRTKYILYNILALISVMFDYMVHYTITSDEDMMINMLSADSRTKCISTNNGLKYYTQLS